MGSNKKKGVGFGIFLACSSAFATGTFGIFLHYMAEFGLSEDTVTLVGPVFMFFAFLAICLIKDPKSLLVEKKLYYVTMIVVSGFILYPLYNYTYVQVFSNLPMAIASLFHFSNSIVLVFLMRILFKEKITKEKIICCILAVVGIMFVLQIITFGTAVPDESVPITAMGIFWGVAVAVSLACVYSIDYFHINRNIPVTTTQTYACMCTSILLLITSNPVTVGHNIAEAVSVNGPVVIFVTLAYCAVLMWSYYAITACYTYIDASFGALTFVLEPSVAAILGFLILKESLTPLQILGIVIAVSAIVFMQYAEGKR
ncbi:MAG: DMT family transporter, partial [Eubacterium sp.]